MTTAELLALLAIHLLLTGLPLAAASLYAARRGLTSIPILLAVGLLASGLVGLLGFWAYYGDRVIGEAFSYFVLLGSLVLGGWSLYGGQIDSGLLRRLATPLVLWIFGSGFLVMFGFMHGGTSPEPLITATTRFSHPLPSDAILPSFFAEWFFHHGHHGTPPMYPPNWLASDRPPLQIGYALYQHPFGWDLKGLSYQVMGVVLQQLWIIGLWALLVAAKANRVTRGLAMVTILASDLAIVNGFFVWPKLLPAAMLLAAAALVLTPLWSSIRRSFWGAALVAGLCAVAMMGHGSSVFGVIPLVIVAAFRGLPSWRWIAVGVAVGIAIMAPWSAYQKYGDPPGNRLTKWTLAGVAEVDSRGVGETVVDAYEEAGVGGALHNKAENFATMSGGTMVPLALKSAFENGSLTEIVRTIRIVFFFYLLPSMGLLLLAPILMALSFRRGRRRPTEWHFALSCYLVALVGSVAWGLLVFGNGIDRTLVHIDSYLIPILGLAGGVAGLRATFPRFAIYYLAFNAVFILAVYTPSFEPPAGSVFSPAAAVLAAAALVGFGCAAFLGDTVDDALPADADLALSG